MVRILSGNNYVTKEHEGLGQDQRYATPSDENV